MTLRIVVLASGSGTLLQSLIDAQVNGLLNAKIVAVGSENPNCEALRRAEKAQIPSYVVEMINDRQAWDEKLREETAAFNPDLIVSAGFMKLLGKNFLNQFGGRTINSHPALLPSFPGIHAVKDALKAGVKITGCSVFMVDEGIDTGEILAQKAVNVLPEDSQDELHERIKIEERKILREVINELAAK